MDKIRNEKALSDAAHRRSESRRDRVQANLQISRPCPAHATFAGASSRSRTPPRSPRRCRWWRRPRCARPSMAALAGRPYANLMNKVLAALVSEPQGLQPSLPREAREPEPLRHPRQHGQGPLRRPQQQPDARSGQVRARTRPSSPPGAKPRNSWRAPSARSSPNSPTRTPRSSARRAPSPNSPRTSTSKAKWTRSIFSSPISFPPWSKSPRLAPTAAHQRNPARHRRHRGQTPGASRAEAGRANFSSSRTRNRCWARCCRTV